MAEVQLKGVVKTFGALDVIKGVDLTIADGEFVVLVGPSGCGKSTLLRMIAGLEEITGGEIAIDGHRVNDLEPRERDIAMVFQSYALYPHMNVGDNMGFSMALKKSPTDQIKDTVAKAADALALGAYLERLPRALSGGQRQRVAMGRAIVRRPKVFLFDEPLSNLDAQLRVQMRTEVRKLHQNLGATSVYVTHDQVEAMTMADRIVVLDKGRIAQVGSPLDLYNRPADRFVAEFIGSPSINLIRATARDGSIALSRSGQAITLPPVVRDRQGDIEIGIRPEHVRPAETGLAGVVQVIEHLGAETYVFVDIGAERDICWRTSGQPNVALGDPIILGFEESDLHIFDAASGARL